MLLMLVLTTKLLKNLYYFQKITRGKSITHHLFCFWHNSGLETEFMYVNLQYKKIYIHSKKGLNDVLMYVLCKIISATTFLATAFVAFQATATTTIKYYKEKMSFYTDSLVI